MLASSHYVLSPAASEQTNGRELQKMTLDAAVLVEAGLFTQLASCLPICTVFSSSPQILDPAMFVSTQPSPATEALKLNLRGSEVGQRAVP